MLYALFTTVAPLFFCAGIGYCWGRFKLPYDTRIITRLVSYIGAPCLIFSTLAEIKGISLEIGEMAGAALAAVVSFALIGALVLRLCGLPVRTFLAAVTFPNAGNLGLPLCLFAYGSQGLALGIGFFSVTATLQLTLGQWLYSRATNPWPALKAPIPYAVLLGVLFMLADIEAPAFLLNTTKLLGGFAIPLMIITLGVSLAQLQIIRFRRTLGLSLLRIGMGIVVGIALATLFGFEGMQRGVFIMLCTMPVAVFNYLFAQFYDNHAEEIASLVVLSSALVFAALPLLVYLIL